MRTIGMLLDPYACPWSLNGQWRNCKRFPATKTRIPYFLKMIWTCKFLQKIYFAFNYVCVWRGVGDVHVSAGDCGGPEASDPKQLALPVSVRRSDGGAETEVWLL